MARKRRPLHRVLRVFIIAISGLILIGLGYLAVISYLEKGAVSYLISANALDTWALDSYPQTIIEQESIPFPVFKITTHPGVDRVNSTPVLQEYPEDIQEYLLPSAKIESDGTDITLLAELIAPGETDSVVIAQEAAQWTAKNIRYDFQLAKQIWNGEIATQGALNTLDRRQGTCSEYANLFIAIMRNKGIPARFVMGKMYLGAYHSWAEIWLEDHGWIPVDPQRGSIGVTARHIKLFAGRDFVDIGVPLKSIEVKIKRLGNKALSEN